MPSLARNIYAAGNGFQVSITYRCRAIYIGRFKTFDEAIEARDRFQALPDEDKAAYLPKTPPKARKFKSDGIKLPYSYDLYEKAKANRVLLSGHKYAVRRAA